MNSKHLMLLVLIISLVNLGIAILYSPLAGLIMTVVVLLVIFFITKEYDPFPIIFIFSLTIIGGFNFTNTGYLIISVLIIIYVICFLINPMYRIKLRTTKFQLFFYLWLLFATLQLLIFPRYDSTWEHYRSLFFGTMVIFLMSRIITTKARLKIVYIFWGISVFITILIGYWEISTGNSFRPTTAYPHLDVATVGFFNHNNYSFYLGLSLPIIFFWLQERAINKMLGFFIIFSIFYLVYINNSRSVLLVIMLFMIVLTIKLLINKKKTLITSTGVVMLIGVFLFINIDYVKDALDSISTLNKSDGSVNVRIQLIKSGIDIFRDNPILGVGPGNSEYFMPNIGDKLHNFWLEILINYGLIVLIGLISFFLYSLYTFLKCRSNELKKISWPLLWSTIIFIPISSTPSSIFNFQILWFYFGMMLCGITIVKNNEIRVNDKNKLAGKFNSNIYSETS